jgi:hypothetical protein
VDRVIEHANAIVLGFSSLSAYFSNDGKLAVVSFSREKFMFIVLTHRTHERDRLCPLTNVISLMSMISICL